MRRRKSSSPAGQRAFVIDAETQELLARWILKLTTMGQFLHPEQERILTADHLRAVREGQIPPDTFIFTTAYEARRETL